MSTYSDLVKVLSGTKAPFYRIATIALAALVERESKKHGVDPLKVVRSLREISEEYSSPVEQLTMVRKAAKDAAYERAQQKIEELQAEQDSLGSTLAYANNCLENGMAALRDSVAKAAAGDKEGAEASYVVASEEFTRCDRAVSLAEAGHG